MIDLDPELDHTLNPNYITTNLNCLRSSGNKIFINKPHSRSQFGLEFSYKMTDYFIYSFASRYNVYGYLSNIDSVISILSAEDEEIIIYVDETRNEAISIMDAGSKVIDMCTTDLFLRRLERGNYKLLRSYVQKACSRPMKEKRAYTEFMVINEVPVNVFPDAISRGLYHMGGLIRIMHDRPDPIRIIPVIKRYMSDGIAIINNRPLCITILVEDQKQTMEKLYEAIRKSIDHAKPEYSNIISNRLKECRNTVASVGECKELFDILDEYDRDDARHMFKFNEMMAHYGLDTTEGCHSPSHANRMQLINIALELAYNRNAQEALGNFIFNSGALEGQNISRLWSSIKSVKLIIADEDSDICSEIESHDDTTGVDDDDIRSDIR